MSGSTSQPEAWLRGALPGFSPLLMPAAHAFVQAAEDVDRVTSLVPDAALWERPGGIASVGYHLMHIAGSTDRLLTYARGEMLTADQMTALRKEGTPPGPSVQAAALGRDTIAALERALAQLRTTDPATLLEARHVGRARLPATVLGLLFHAAEHAARHVGQAITTAKLLRAMSDGDCFLRQPS